MSQKCGQSWGVGEPVKIFLSSSLITIQNLFAVCCRVWAHVGRPNTLRYWHPQSLRRPTVSCSNTHFPHVTISNFVSLCQTIGAYCRYGSRKTLGTVGPIPVGMRDVAGPLETHLFPHVGHSGKVIFWFLVVLGQTVRA